MKKKSLLAWGLFTHRGHILCNGGMPLVFKTKSLAQHHIGLMPNSNWNVSVVRIKIVEVCNDPE